MTTARNNRRRKAKATKSLAAWRARGYRYVFIRRPPTPCAFTLADLDALLDEHALREMRLPPTMIAAPTDSSGAQRLAMELAR